MKPFYERYEEFCGIEIQNVCIVVDHDTGQISYEAGLKNPDMYGVYMIFKEGTVEHVADVPHKGCGELPRNPDPRSVQGAAERKSI